MEYIILNNLENEISRLELNYPNFHKYKINKLKQKLKRIKNNLNKRKNGK